MIIDARETTIGTILDSSSVVFKIPIYQRSYSWGKDQWNQLWYDLIGINEGEKHFLGSIVVVGHQHNFQGFNYLEVVDGQQRLTTILLCLIALRDLIESVDRAKAAFIDERFLHTSTMEDRTIKLELGRYDKDVFDKLIEKESLAQEQNKSLIVQGYNFFKHCLEERVQNDAWNDVRKNMLSSMNLVVITTKSHYGAFRLFETLNNRGLELSSVDLIKNYILGKISENEVVLEKCIRLWDSIIRNLDDIEKVKFFRHYLFSTESGVVSKSELYDKYQKIIDEKQSIQEFLEDIFEKSEQYRELYYGQFRNKKLNRRIISLRKIEASTSYTLLLRALSERLIDDQLIKIVHAIEIFTLRRSICQTTTRDLDRIYNHLSTEAFKHEDPVLFIIEYLKQSTPSDDDFVNSFANRLFNRSDQTKYILESIEDFTTNSTGEKSINGREEVHIEHIMPVEISSKKSLKKFGDWESLLGDEAREHKFYINRIGNLTLLGSEMNIVASNNPFEDKKKEYKKSNIVITNDVCWFSKWGLNEIEIRSRKLAEIAVEIWNYNKVTL